MKTILLMVHDDPGQEARLQAALDLTRAFDGHMTCLDIAVMPLLMADFYAGAGTAMLLAEERRAESANFERIEARLTHEDVAWSLIETAGTLAPILRRAAALADVIVVNRQLDLFFGPDMRALVGDLVLTSGRPVLAVPQDGRGIDLRSRALVCWDGSPAAQAALQAAVPLLQRANAVELLEVSDGSVGVPAEDAAAYLSRYGIHPQVSRRHRVKDRAKAILDEAAKGFSYVVMGGFGHSRFRETLFGGVTRTMLEKSPVPLFLAH